MRRKFIWWLASLMMVLALLAAACAPAEEAAPTGQTPSGTTPAAKQEVAPAEKETTAPTTGKDMVKVSWPNGDGVMVQKEIERPQYGGIARYLRTSSIISWDEAFQTPWSNKAFAHPFEKLIQGEWPRGPAVTGEVDWITGGWMRVDYSYGELAESWEFPDMETAIFHIRKGVHYAIQPGNAASDLVGGREFNAHDVVFNIKRIYQDIKTSTMYGMAGTASRVLDVYAPDDWTVVIKSPPGQIGKTWEYVADWSYMSVPPEVIQKYGDVGQWDTVVGTGPFILTDYVAMASATYRRNPDYWMKDPLIPENQLPYLDGLKLFIIPDLSTATAAIRTAKVDWYHAMEEEDALPVIRGNPEIQYYGRQRDGFSSLGWRMDRQDLPFKDINVRRALSMAINMPEIVDTFYGGKGGVLCFKVIDAPMFKDVHTPVEQLPMSADGFDNRRLYNYGPYTYEENLAEARRLLADAGYPNGFQYSVITTSTAAYTDHLQMAQAYWAKIGVDMKLDIKESAVRNGYFQRKDFPEAITGGRWSGEPYTFLMMRKNNMWNWGYVDNPKFDAYYDEMTALYFKPKERDVVMKEANLAAIDYVPYYTFPVGWRYQLWWPWVKNFDGIYSLGIGGYYFQKYMWIDQDLKQSMGY